MQKLHFISGLPRSGSTLLAALLRQNPRFYADITSPVGSLFQSNIQLLSTGSEFAARVSDTQRRAVLQGLFTSFYSTIYDRAVIFDTNRLWCSRLPAIASLFPEAKVICCVRNLAWIMDSFERLFQNYPYYNSRLFNDAAERETIYSRLEALGQGSRVVGFAYNALKEAFYGSYADRLLLVEYELLAAAPAKVMALIYQFLGEPPFAHNFDWVEYESPEVDRWLGLKDLHRVSGKVELRARQTVLPPDLFEKYSALSFWQDPTGSRANLIATNDGSV